MGSVIAIVDTKGIFAQNVKMDIMMLAMIPAIVCIFVYFDRSFII